jgi:hypothetical protein
MDFFLKLNLFHQLAKYNHAYPNMLPVFFLQSCHYNYTHHTFASLSPLPEDFPLLKYFRCKYKMTNK